MFEIEAKLEQLGLPEETVHAILGETNKTAKFVVMQRKFAAAGGEQIHSMNMAYDPTAPLGLLPVDGVNSLLSEQSVADIKRIVSETLFEHAGTHPALESIELG